MNKDFEPAIFLDRDGTLIEDRGHLCDPSEVVFFANTFEALRRLQQHFRLFIITNQSGVGEGIINIDGVNRVNQHIIDVLKSHNIDITDIYVCPHSRQDNCLCRKPASFFLEQAASKHNIDLKRSFSIGDHPCDPQLAANVGGKGVFILTGHGNKHLNELDEGVKILPDIKAAADWILSQNQPSNISSQASDISRAAEIIRQGGLVAFPTETVYGLGANALDTKAVARIYEAKQRPYFDPLIVHISEYGQAEELVTEFPPAARRLTDIFSPGPLTVILPKSQLVPDIVTAGMPTVAIRIPSHPIAQRLIKEAQCPVAAPSANLFGSISPTCAEHVRRQLGQSVDFILDGGDCSVGIESTIISFAGTHPILLRPGGITVEQIEAVIGKIDIAGFSEHKSLSPGRLERHYAPKTPLRLVDKPVAVAKGKRVGLLSLEPIETQGFAQVEVLSKTANLAEAATNLFAAMRRLDEANLDLIIAVKVPDGGVGRAINDRLSRAGRDG